MSNGNLSRLQNETGASPVRSGDLALPSPHRFWHACWQIIKTLQARLRFIAILALVGAAIMYWDTLKAHYEKWTRPLPGEEAAASADTEYWCPMHPTIVRDHPDKCPLCGMPLSKRKKEAGTRTDEALPPGVVSRVQLTPYRVAIAGIQTTPIEYQPLAKEITTVGFVEFDEQKLARISVRPTGKSRIDKLYVNVTGQNIAAGEPLAELYSADLLTTVTELQIAQSARDKEMVRNKLRLWGIGEDQIRKMEPSATPSPLVTIRAPFREWPGTMWHVIKKYAIAGQYLEEGKPLFDLADLSTVWIEAQVYEDEIAFLHEGLPVSATTETFPGREFKGKLAFVHPHLDASTRTLKVRFDMDNPDHELRPGMYATVTLRVPVNRLNLLPRDADEKQRQSYGQGLVLAVPERAVIDTGSRKIVYREAEPDVYEGVEVQLGPRCGVFYPVIKGLKAGDKVATAGSFLIDAETRLTAGAGSTYFGASGGPPRENHRSATTARPSMTRDDEETVQAALAKLNPEDQRLAKAQGYCPILQANRLGLMGTPIKITLQGQPVFLCCPACEEKAREHPDQTLARVEKLKTKVKRLSTGR
jgi:Cu(I)/Ag(I) efflux system membrane fusion protein